MNTISPPLTVSEVLLVGILVGLVFGIPSALYLFFALKSPSKLSAKEFHFMIFACTFLVVLLTVICPKFDEYMDYSYRVLCACLSGTVFLMISLPLFAASYYVKLAERKYYRIIALNMFIAASAQWDIVIWWAVKDSLPPFVTWNKMIPILAMATCELWFLSINNQQFLPKRLK